VRIADQGQIAEVEAGVRGAILTELTQGGHASERVQHLDVDHVWRMEITILGKAFDEAGRGLAGNERFERG
jgi:hypothetical protein